jgi:2-polyprenyl-3-methyl-5-hydroxy-6-metoxy-1,4-benzoquinol methylase
MDNVDPGLPGETKKHIVNALYHAFLHRDPDAEGLRAYLQALGNGLSLEGLMSAFLSSPEFHAKLPNVIGMYPLDSAPAIPVDVDISPAQLRTLWGKVARAWSNMGEHDPYRSVLTHDQYRIDRMRKQEAIDAFYETGRENVARMRTWLDRNGCSLPAHGTCVDYGCGVGRVTLWLARTFKKVIAVDISESHIRLAREYLERKNIGNVDFHLLRGEDDLQITRGADFLFSMIVLQHNPPPIIKSILTAALSGMRADGLAFFQVPTYMKGYQFNVERYLASPTSGLGMEMHMLPQSEVFTIAQHTNCMPLEVQPDWLTGMWGSWISNTFLLKKSTVDFKTEKTWWGRLTGVRQ